jgi:REP element-mobilizing transposase RayT
MVRWYHAIFSAYGFWLPNDPRGSWSDFVQSWDLYRFGSPATTVNGKRSYAHDPHDAAFRREAKEHLKHPPARFDSTRRESIARGFTRACGEFGFVLYACAIGFDHVHIIAARDGQRSIEQIVAVLKARATQQMNAEGTHPMRGRSDSKGVTPTPWGRSCWSVFINDDQQLRSAVAYVQRHPVKEGLPRQAWDFLTPF